MPQQFCQPSTLYIVYVIITSTWHWVTNHRRFNRNTFSFPTSVRKHKPRDAISLPQTSLPTASNKTSRAVVPTYVTTICLTKARTKIILWLQHEQTRKLVQVFRPPSVTFSPRPDCGVRQWAGNCVVQLYRPVMSHGTELNVTLSDVEIWWH